MSGVPRFLLAPKGPEVSALAYGCWRLTEDPEGSAPARIRAKIDACLAAGITTFDHADIYGDYTCEGLFGRALAEAPGLRKEIEIVTKCGCKCVCDNLPDTWVSHYDASAAWIEQRVDRSLRELHTDYIDLLLVHRPDWLTDARDTARGLLRVIDAGKVRSVGVSNYNVHQYALLAQYLGFAPATNQVEIHLLHMDALCDGTLEQCQSHDVHPMAWSPMAGGRIFSDVGPAAERLREALARIGAHYGASADQIALAWVAALPSRPQLVIGTNRIDRIQASAASCAIQLERQHWFELWEAARGEEVP